MSFTRSLSLEFGEHDITCTFLASREGGYVAAHTIGVNGGRFP